MSSVDSPVCVLLTKIELWRTSCLLFNLVLCFKFFLGNFLEIGATLDIYFCHLRPLYKYLFFTSSAFTCKEIIFLVGFIKTVNETFDRSISETKIQNKTAINPHLSRCWKYGSALWFNSQDGQFWSAWLSWLYALIDGAALFMSINIGKLTTFLLTSVY